MGPTSHRFPVPSDMSLPEDAEISFVQGDYAALVRSPEYALKKKEDQESYAWDGLISEFTKHILGGTSVEILGKAPEAKLAERALRIMASEPRISRRALGHGIIEAVKVFRARTESRYARMMRPQGAVQNADVMYIFMQFKVEPEVGTYDNYRRVRAQMLETYCYAVLRRFPDVRTAVGIAMEPPSSSGGSEDLIALQVDNWSAETLADLEERSRLFGILKETNPKVNTYHVEEYPVPAHRSAVEPGYPNRHQRRKAARLHREK